MCRSQRQVPRTAIWVDRRVRGRRQRAVNRPLLLRFRGMVDRGPYKRVTEGDPRLHVQEAFVCNRLCRRTAHADLRGSAPDERGISRGLGRRDKQKATGLRRQTGESSSEARLDSARHRNGYRKRESSEELPRRQSARQLEQRERIPARLIDDALEHVMVDAIRKRRTKQCQGSRAVQSRNLECR